MDTKTNNPKKILVVDDEKYVLIIIKFNLKKFNYTVLTANNGEQALKIASEEKPDLIILDIMMAGMDGFEVCKRLKDNKTTAKIPVIFLTARGMDTDKIKAKELGVLDYFTKPFSIPDFISTIEKRLKIR